MGAIVVDCSVLSSDTPKVRFHLSMETTSREIIKKLLVSFDMASRDPRLFYISMEMTKGSSENTIPGILSLKDDNRPLELSSSYKNSRFRIQMRSGGVVKVYDTCLVPNSFYKSMLVSRKTTSAELVQLMLNYHKRTEEADDYVLVEMDEQQKDVRALKADDLPLLLTQMSQQNSSFQLRTAESVRALNAKSTSRLSPDAIRNSFAAKKKKTLRFSSDLQHEDEVQEWERDVAIAKLRTNLRQLEKEKGTFLYNKEPPQSLKTGANLASGTKEFLKAKLEKLKLRRKSSKKDENDNVTESPESKQNLSQSTETLDSSGSSVQELESKLDDLEHSLHGKMELGFSRNTRLRQSLPIRLHSDRRTLSDFIRKEGSEEVQDRSDLTAQYIERLRRKYTPDKARALEDAKRLVGLSRSASMKSNLSRTSSVRSRNETDNESIRESLKLDLSSVVPDSSFLPSDRSMRSSRSSYGERIQSARDKTAEKVAHQQAPASARYGYDAYSEKRSESSGYESRLSYSTYSGSSRSQDSSVTTPRGGDSSQATPRNDDDSQLSTPRGALTTPRGVESSSLVTHGRGGSSAVTPRVADQPLNRERANTSPGSRGVATTTPRSDYTPTTPRSRLTSEPRTPRSQRKYEETWRDNKSDQFFDTDLDAELQTRQHRRLEEERSRLGQDTARRKAEIERLLEESQSRKEALTRSSNVCANPDYVPSGGLSRSGSLRRSFRDSDRASLEERRQKLMNGSTSGEVGGDERTDSSTISYTRRKYPDAETREESTGPTNGIKENTEEHKNTAGEETRKDGRIGSAKNVKHFTDSETRNNDIVPKPSEIGQKDEKESSTKKVSTAHLVLSVARPDRASTDAEQDSSDSVPVAKPRSKTKINEAKKVEKKDSFNGKSNKNDVENVPDVAPEETKRSANSSSTEIETLKGAVGSAITMLANKVAARQNSAEKARESLNGETGENPETPSSPKSSVRESESPVPLNDVDINRNTMVADSGNVVPSTKRKRSVEDLDQLLDDVDKRLLKLKVKHKENVDSKAKTTAKRPAKMKAGDKENTTAEVVRELEAEKHLKERLEKEYDTSKINSSAREVASNLASEQNERNVLKPKLDEEGIPEKRTPPSARKNPELSEELASEDVCSQSSEDNEEWSLALEDVNNVDTEQSQKLTSAVVREGNDRRPYSSDLPVSNTSTIESKEDLGDEERVVEDAEESVRPQLEVSSSVTMTTTDVVPDRVGVTDRSQPEVEEPAAAEVTCSADLSIDGGDGSESDSSSSAASSVREVTKPRAASTPSLEDDLPAERDDQPETGEDALEVSESMRVTESEASSSPALNDTQSAIVDNEHDNDSIRHTEELSRTASDSPDNETIPPEATSSVDEPKAKPEVENVSDERKSVSEYDRKMREDDSESKTSRAITKKEKREEALPSYLFQASQEDELTARDEPLSLSSNSPIDENFEKMLAEETSDQPPPQFPALSSADESQKEDITLSQILDTTKKTDVDNGSPKDDDTLDILKSDALDYRETERRTETIEKQHQLREQRMESRDISERMRGLRRPARSDEQWYADLKKLKNNGLWYGNRDPVPERKVKDEEEVELRSKRVIARGTDQRAGRRSENLDVHKSMARREERARRPTSQNDLVESRTSSRASSRASSRGASLMSEDGRPRTLEKSREIIAQILSPSRFEPREIPKRNSSSQTENVVQKANSPRSVSKPTFFTLLKACEVFEVTVDTAGYPGHGLKLFESTFETVDGVRSPDGRKPAIGQRQGAFARLRERILSVLCVDGINKKCLPLYKGRLQEGDYVIEVNGESCLANDLTKVVAILEENRPGVILELVVARRKLEDKNQLTVRYPFSHLPDTDLEKQLVKLQLDAFNMRRDLQQKDKLVDELRMVMVKNIPVRQVKDGMKPSKFDINDLEEDSFFV